MYEYFKALQETGKRVSISTTIREDDFTRCTVKEVRQDCIIIQTKDNLVFLVAMSHIVDVFLSYEPEDDYD